MLDLAGFYCTVQVNSPSAPDVNYSLCKIACSINTSLQSNRSRVLTPPTRRTRPQVTSFYKQHKEQVMATNVLDVES